MTTNFEDYEPEIGPDGWLRELIVFHVPQHDFQVIRFDEDDDNVLVKIDGTIQHMSVEEVQEMLGLESNE